MPSRSRPVARERLRRSYRPGRTKILFVGEAPPASGRFFYKGDSGLYRAVRQAFIDAHPSITDADFLKTFRSLGCYLVDLCGRPVDRLGRKSRAKICHEGENSLAKTIKRLKPAVIISLVRSIEANVRRAQAQAGWKGVRVEVPYPGRWHRHRDEFCEFSSPGCVGCFPRSDRASPPNLDSEGWGFVRLLKNTTCPVVPAILSMERILVVEDDRAVQKALKRLFEGENFSVEISADGKSAVDAFRRATPAAIVLDLRLPAMSGRDVCQEVKRLSPSVPIIVLSAASDVSDKVLLLELGADDYVTKPFSPRELLARVRAALRRNARTGSGEVSTFDRVSVDFSKMEVLRGRSGRIDRPGIQDAAVLPS